MTNHNLYTLHISITLMLFTFADEARNERLPVHYFASIETTTKKGPNKGEKKYFVRLVIPPFWVKEQGSFEKGRKYKLSRS